MHSFLPLLPLLAIPTHALLSGPCTPQTHPSLYAAITSFCAHQPALVVPSSHAGTGSTGLLLASDGVRVWIDGTCFPPQWVPERYCTSQFGAMCAEGVGERRFGRPGPEDGGRDGGCQRWISYGPEGHGQPPQAKPPPPEAKPPPPRPPAQSTTKHL